MAEVQGIEPSTLRWHGFQDRLSTLLAYLHIFGRRCRIRTCDPLLPKQMRYQTALISVISIYMVLRQGIDPWSLDYQSSALPLSYQRMVDPLGIEPRPDGLKDRCPNQLCEGSIVLRWMYVMDTNRLPYRSL